VNDGGSRIQLDDDLIARLSLIARSRGQALEDYLRDLVIAEARSGDAEDTTGA